jgi:hypothetical protein
MSATYFTWNTLNVDVTVPGRKPAANIASDLSTSKGADVSAMVLAGDGRVELDRRAGSGVEDCLSQGPGTGIVGVGHRHYGPDGIRL